MTATMLETAGGLRLSAEAAELAARVRGSVVAVRGSRFGGGSGVVWGEDGLVVTNHHVVPNERAEVALGDGTRLSARVTRRDPRLDLAALRVEGRLIRDGIGVATVGDSSSLRVGELVVAVGNPLGERNAVVLGMVSGVGAFNWPGGQQAVIRAAITLRPGNSGGALADVHGQIVGIPHMVVGPGLALAVPSASVRQFLLDEPAGRGFLGVMGRWLPLPQAAILRHGLPSPVGMLLEDVTAGSPAERAGLTLGDVLVGIGGPRPDERGAYSDLVGEFASLRAGAPVRIAALRGGELHWFEVTPGAKREV